MNPSRNVLTPSRLECNKIVPSMEPWILEYCREVDFSTQDSWARAYGRSRPSRTVLEIPELGTAEAQQSGVSCAEGRVIAKIGNAWVQPLDRERNYLRCRPTIERPAISIGR